MKLWFVCFVAGSIWHEAKPQVKSEFRSIRPWGEIRVSWPGSRAAPRTKKATFLESKAQWGEEKTASSSFGGGYQGFHLQLLIVPYMDGVPWAVTVLVQIGVYCQEFGRISTGVIHLRFPSPVLFYLGVSPLPCVSVWVRCRNAPCPGLFSP